MNLQSENINEISAALSKAQIKMKVPAKDKVNPHFRNRYCSLGSVISSCKDALNECGISMTQPLVDIDGKTYVVTTLSHSSGQWMRSYLSLRAAENANSQQMGSALTYARRYSLCAMVGIDGDEDDDGEAAAQAPSQKWISKEKFDTMMSIISHDPQLVMNLKKLCKVDELQNITDKQYDACREYTKNYLNKKQSEAKTKETEAIHKCDSDSSDSCD